MLTKKKQLSEAFDTPHQVGNPDFFGKKPEKDVEAKTVPVDFVTDRYGKKFPADQYVINESTGRANKIKK